MDIVLKGFRQAHANEAEHLSALALLSKGYWGYSESFLEACRKELTYTATYIETNTVMVLETNRGVFGFYAFRWLDEQELELEALFLDPGVIGRGWGRALMADAKAKAAELGAKSILIHGDPHAVPFYLSQGAEHIGSVPSGSIPGRELPLFRLQVEQPKPA